MASSSVAEPLVSSHEFKVLQDHIDELVSALKDTDLMKFSMQLFKRCVISKDVKNKFGSLDHDRLEAGLKVRYLLQHVFDMVKYNSATYYGLRSAMSELGESVIPVCKFLDKELEKCMLESQIGQASDSTGGSKAAFGTIQPELLDDISISEEHVTNLTEILVNSSSKWEIIGIGLNLPIHVLEECRSGSNNAVKLYKIIHAWITGKYKHARPATLNKLKDVLASELVGLGRVANILEKKFLKDVRINSLSTSNRPREDSALKIEYQSSDTEVADGKSTLLEVQGIPNEPISYQWKKDGQPLSNLSAYSAYSGKHSSILLVDHANQGTKGSYSCCISKGSEEMNSEEITLTVVFPKVKKHLINLYSNFNEVPEDSWPPVGASIFINLAIIKKNKSNNDDYDYSVLGDMDDILERKEKIKYDEVFGKYESGALVLIEGRPGSGKTTLVHKVTRDWATRGDVLRNAKMVFLISLRVLDSNRKDETLLDILEMFYDDNGELLHDIKRSDGEGVCFIIDGLDEYQPKDNSETVINKLLYNKLLPRAMVIVASRPVATARLRHKATKRVEVLGFTKKHIDEYIDNYLFKSNNIPTKLKMYLQSHSNVLHMCYLPVLAAMICFLYNQFEDGIPRTETQIYELFTRFVLLRKLRRANAQAKLMSLDDLSGEDKKYFTKICSLAFHMTINSKQVVCQSDTEVPLSPGTGSDAPSLGLATIDCTAKLIGVEDLYTFLHLTFQEYLAAFHITRLGEKEQIKIIRQHGRKGHMQMVWKFFCGINKFEGKIAELQEIMKSAEKDSLYGVQCAFESQQCVVCNSVVDLGESGALSFKDHILTPADFTAMGYVISEASHSVTKLEFVNCKLEEDGVRAFLKEVKHKLNSIKYLCFQRENCNLQQFRLLNSIFKKLPSLEELDLKKTVISKESVKVLTENVTLLSLRVLTIHKSWSKLENELNLLKFGSDTLEQVQCSYNLSKHWDILFHTFGFRVRNIPTHITWYNSTIDLNYVLPYGFSECIKFDLFNCDIDDREVTFLANGLKNSHNLQTLKLDFNRISGRGARALANILQTCTKTKKLSAHCNQIDDSGALALADGLVHCSSLEKLDLQCNAIGDKGAVAIAKAVKHLHKKFVLNLCNVNITNEGAKRILEHKTNANVTMQSITSSWEAITKDGPRAVTCALKCCKYLNVLTLQISDETCLPSIAALAEGLKSCNNLQTMDLSLISIGPDDIAAIANLLQCCTNLQTLNLLSNNFISDIAVALADGLKCCTNLQTLNLSKNKITSDGATALAIVLQCYTNLQTLNLTKNEVCSDGAAALAEGLKCCTKLHALYLSGNNIGPDGAAVLAYGLKHCATLETLDVSWNNIGPDDATFLAYELKCCTNLQTLNISGNHIGPDHTAALAFELKCCTYLQTLNLSQNEISSVGAAALAEGLKHCTNIQALDLSHNHIDSYGAAALADGLKCCTNLQTLNLSNNHIDSDGATALAIGLKFCTNLQALYLPHNQIGTCGTLALADKLQCLTLDLSGNKINVEGEIALLNRYIKK